MPGPSESNESPLESPPQPPLPQHPRTADPSNGQIRFGQFRSEVEIIGKLRTLQGFRASTENKGVTGGQTDRHTDPYINESARRNINVTHALVCRISYIDTDHCSKPID